MIGRLPRLTAASRDQDDARLERVVAARAIDRIAHHRMGLAPCIGLA